MSKDVQNQKDHRQIPVDRVGVKNVHYPIVVLDKADKFQNTVASVNMYVNLPQDFKGTHMSRFIEVLNEHHGRIDIRNFNHILEDLMKSLNAKAAHIELEFPYFINKKAPVSREQGLVEYICSYIVNRAGEKSEFLVGIQVPITTLCPCSKDMSSQGAHNQRGLVKVTLKFKKFFWIEDVIDLVESSASAPVYSLLKREDEKYITERAYENPRFVEDVVREVALRLQALPGLRYHTIEVENFESIHNHSAYAVISKRFDAG